MALMICPECGGQVSDKAHTCPHCVRAAQPLRANWKARIDADVQKRGR